MQGVHDPARASNAVAVLGSSPQRLQIFDAAGLGRPEPCAGTRGRFAAIFVFR
jgi:hypothetical protein